jgi:integrase/recombinase XerD
VTPLQSYARHYLERLRVQGKSEATVHAHRSATGLFLAWAAERSVQRPEEVTLAVLERYARAVFYLRKANGQPLTLAAQRQRLAPLRGFFAWLTRERLIAANPAADLVLPKSQRRLPRRLLSVAEFEDLVRQTAAKGAIGVRDRAILEILFATGIRRLELASLSLLDVDRAAGTLAVREGKGRKDRLIPIGERALVWIERYLAEVRPQLAVDPAQPALFLTDHGQAFVKNRLSDLVKGYLRAIGIEGYGSCHLFRHSMATLMLENGADLRFIQAMLGHADLNTTTIYTRVAIGKLKDVYARTHPTAGLRERPTADTDWREA